MKRFPPQLSPDYASALDAAGVVGEERDEAFKWLRYYLDFCAKYRFPPRDDDSLMPFVQSTFEVGV